ncbi:DUF1024 family protein [Staphylococcus sp. GDY8P19P]|uniref:DUF1024 family protein n=1 Tax=Staphylococcus sp. GDY8P19P TaxID=2804415 RepID=UPI00195145B6|nr:DUF1024 family protein [Staphylococcus sp. GDY8P19P]
MAYEYEMKKLITKLSGVWVDSEKKEILKELQEVYRKAKAFDEIAEVHSDNDHYSDEYVLETIQEQIDELERADDER